MFLVLGRNHYLYFPTNTYAKTLPCDGRHLGFSIDTQQTLGRETPTEHILQTDLLINVSEVSDYNTFQACSELNTMLNLSRDGDHLGLLSDIKNKLKCNKGEFDDHLSRLNLSL